MNKNFYISFIGLVLATTILLTVMGPAFAMSVLSLEPSYPILKSIDMTSLEGSPTAGNQYIIFVNAKNNEVKDLEYLLMIEIRDPDDFTESVIWQGGMLSGGSETAIGASWIPLKIGTYSVRTWGLTGLENPRALGPVADSFFTVKN
ncbi:MAG: hypothetical protein DA330_08485 [Nitrososphaera sp.]|nr:hypothetical protein [Nitrososphaera sp.]